MIYNNKEIPKLGFGLMRLPMIEDEIDIEQTKQMVDAFMANGFTYFDTAYGYLNQRSEGAAKVTLVDRYPRESFQLATKLPAWTTDSKEKAEQMFYTSLERAGVDYFDFYLLHNLGSDRTNSFDNWDMWNFVFKQKELGKIKNVGFSLHDNADVLDDLLTKHPEVDFIQLQINYADWNDAVVQSKKCYEVAKKHGKPVIVMEPIRGGTLADPPKQVKDILDAVNSEMPYAIWALKFVASKENIVTVLSGMSTIEQMEENIKYLKDVTPLTEQEEEAIVKAQEALKAIPSIPCTACQYCVKDCPMSIRIPDIFGAMNKELVYDDKAGAKGTYGFSTKSTPTLQKGKASDCIGCKNCEAVCPQFINIVEQLEKAVAMYE